MAVDATWCDNHPARASSAKEFLELHVGQSAGVDCAHSGIETLRRWRGSPYSPHASPRRSARQNARMIRARRWRA